MCNSLTTQYLFQASDYRPFTLKVGCISGCASDIPPLLKLGQRVDADYNIIQRFKALCCKDFSRLFYLYSRLRRGLQHFAISLVLSPNLPSSKKRSPKLTLLDAIAKLELNRITILLSV